MWPDVIGIAARCIGLSTQAIFLISFFCHGGVFLFSSFFFSACRQLLEEIAQFERDEFSELPSAAKVCVKRQTGVLPQLWFCSFKSSRSGVKFRSGDEA